ARRLTGRRPPQGRGQRAGPRRARFAWPPRQRLGAALGHAGTGGSRDALEEVGGAHDPANELQGLLDLLPVQVTDVVSPLPLTILLFPDANVLAGLVHVLAIGALVRVLVGS